MFSFFFGSKVRSITSICTMLAAVFGVIVGIGPALAVLDSWSPLASKVFVETRVDPIVDDNKQLHTAQDNTTRAVYQLQLQNLQSSLYAAKLDQQKSPGLPTVDQRVQDLSDEIKNLQDKLNSPTK